MRERTYPQLHYASIELEADERIPDREEKHVRLSVPESFPRNRDLTEAGYVMVDRTIEAKVPVAVSRIDFQKYCRLPVVRSTEGRERIRAIAQGGFQQDHRFLVANEDGGVLAKKLIDAWVDETGETFQCFQKDIVVGFASVVCSEEHGGTPFIRLAAVDQHRRTPWTASSLYAAVFAYYQGEGKKYVCGRISTRNMAVMNLYASFGALFSEPLDIYIKR